MRSRWFFLQALCVACGVEAADIGGYFHEARQRECSEWIAAAQRDVTPELHYRVGLCYWNGWGVAEDRVAAAAWLRKAAEHGHPEAQRRLLDAADRDAVQRESQLQRRNQ